MSCGSALRLYPLLIIILADGAKIKMIRRNIEKEQEFLKKLTSLHSNFIRTDNSFNLVLKGVDVLKNNWFSIDKATAN